MTAQSELVEFLVRLKAHRSRLSDLGRTQPSRDSAASPDPVQEAAELAEALLVAEEELRAQHEELAAVRLELDRVLARNEELFGSPGDAYAITDAQGMIVETNRAAQELFGMTRPGTRRPIASMFSPPNRRTIRALISRAAVSTERQTGEVWLDRGGQDVPVEVSVELRTEPLTGAALLRWRVTPQRGKQRPLLRLVTTDQSGNAVPATGRIAPDGELRRLLSLARADLAAELSGEHGPETLLARVVELTLRWVPGTEHASVTRVVDEHTLRTTAATDHSASACDRLQNQTQQGPAFDAIGEHATVRVDDLSRERRWPALARRIGKTQVRSVLVCELPVTRGAPATLNLYSSRTAAFTAIAELVAPVFAARASIALGHTDDVHNLRQAIASRQTIGQAAGILMERHKLTAAEALDRMVAAAQSSHIKLSELAAQVAETGEEPDDISPAWAAAATSTGAHVSEGNGRPRRRSDGAASDNPVLERMHEQMPVPTGPLADITLRLFAEFAPQVQLDSVLDTVRECCGELDAVPDAALPELVERLARQRLNQMSENPPSQQ